MNRPIKRQQVPQWPIWPTTYRIDDWRAAFQKNFDTWRGNLARYLTEQVGELVEQVNTQVQGRGADIVSDARVRVTHPIHRVSGSATITSIVPPNAQLGVEADQVTPRFTTAFTGTVVLIPTAGSTWGLGTGGNIAKAATAVVGQAMLVVFDGELWAPAS